VVHLGGGTVKMTAARGSDVTRPRLLIIEDDAAVVRNWFHLLGGRFDVASVESFEAAWRATDPESWDADPFHYVLLDLRLPDGNGVDLLDRLNAADPRPSVAVISGFLDAHQALAIHGRCAIAVPKPADREVLLGVLAILEGARSGGSLIASFADAHGLSSQETRLLLAAAREATNEEAADELGCTNATVRSYWRRIFEKTGRRSAREVITQLFRFAIAPHRHAGSRAQSRIARADSRSR